MDFALPLLLPNAEFTQYDGFVCVEQQQFALSFTVSREFATKSVRSFACLFARLLLFVLARWFCACVS